MSNRKSWTDNEKIILYNEVDGLCPLCSDKLVYKKNNQTLKEGEIAHIYPYSPTKKELIILKDVNRLSKTSEDMKNVIYLCKKCHGQFDNPRTLDEYNNLLRIKKNLIQRRETQEEFHSFKIDDEIKKVLNILSNDSFDDSDIELRYEPIKIDKKINSTMKALFKRKIKNDVSEFFNIIKQEFKNIDSIKATKAEQIATQVKSFYLETSNKCDNQEEVYNLLVEWLDRRTNISKEASAIVISFFVQNCEVFNEIS